MKKSNYSKLFSTFLALLLVLSMLTPLTASANTDPADAVETAEQTEQTVKAFKENLADESTMQQKAAIAEQLNLLGGEAKLHDELQNVTGNQQVPVIIHLSEKSVGLQKGIRKLAGKSFSSSEAQQTKQKVRAQQAMAKREMVIKGIQFNEGFSYDTVLNGMSGTVKADDLPKLLEVTGVTLVEPDTIVHALELGKSNTPSKLNGLKKPAPSESKLEEKAKGGQVGPAMDTSIGFLGIEPLWAEGYEGQGINVAVLDTGIDADHPDFQGIYKGGKNFVPHTGNDYTRPRADDDASETSPVERPDHRPEVNATGHSFYTSHGTHVAGTIAAIGNNEYGIKGIAPKVDLYAYRVLGAYGSGSTSGIVAAIDYAVQQEMDVINLSLGGGSNTETDAGSFAINNAMLAGTISVVATGNSGPNRGTMGTPSTARLGIAVGNTTNPEAHYFGDVNINAGSYNLSKTLNLMGTTYGANLADQLNGEYSIVAVPGIGSAANYAGLDVNGKVALVARGEIPFVEKIEAAKDNGAVAIIVHNFAGGTGAPGPSGTFLGDAFEFIPTFDMSQTDGEAIRAALAQAEGTISFGNFDKTLTAGDEVTASSSRGPSTPNFDIKPDVTAPGTNIMSTIPMYKADFPEATYEHAYTRKTGTSMATPHIAGIAALVKQANPNWDAFDVKVALSNTAKVLDTSKYDVFAQGAGRVQAYQAVHPEILAYAIDTANNDGQTVENKKGTVTFGPQDLSNDISVTKEILVKNEYGSGGTYNATVEVTKGFADATVTIDKPTFTLSGEETLNVTLTASQASNPPPGSEILGYIHITGGSTTASLPFAADFGGEAAVEIRNMDISETDLSFNGDGVKDEAVLSFQITGDVATNYIELWDIMDPEGGVYGDGYIGYLHAGSALGAGSYTLRIGGTYNPWDGSGSTAIPDGLYTVDFTALTVSGNPPIIGDYVGPVVVKSEAGTIEGEIEGKTATGQIDDAYIAYQAELVYYGMGYDINTKLKATYEVLKDEEVVSSGPVTLEQDGTFEFELPELSKKDNSVKVKYEDAAGNKAEAIIYNAGDQVDDEVEYEVNHEALTLEVGASEQLTVIETTTKADGTTEEQDVTADATFTSADESIATVENGNVTAVAAGTTEITVEYEEFTATIAVEVTAEPDTVTYSVNKTDVNLEEGELEQLTVTETTVKPDGTTEENDVTADATFASADESIATVENGTVTAVSAGTTEITVTYEEFTATVAVEVTAKPAPGEETVVYSVNKTNLVLGVGQQEQLFVTQTTVKPDGTVIEKDVTGQLRYNVVNNTYATVQKGLVTARQAGKTQVRIQIEGQESIYVYLEVKALPQDSITYTVNTTHLNIGVGQQEQVFVTETTVKPDGTVIERDVTGFGQYRVIDNSVATVKKGLVTGLKAGQSQLRINVYDNNNQDNLKETIYVYVKVEAAPQDVVTYTLNMGEMTMEVGQQTQLRVTETTVKPDGGTTYRDATVDTRFNVVNNTLATVQRGLVTAHAPGKTQVRVVMPNGDVTLVYLEVVGAPEEPEQPEEPETPDTITFSVNKTSVSLTEGDTDSLAVTLTTTKADGTSLQDDATSTSTFTSANENVATVTNDGFITAVGAGETVITVTNGEFTTTVSVTVEAVQVSEPEIQKFVVTEEAISISHGDIVLDLSAFEGETDIELSASVLKAISDSNKDIEIQKDGAVFSLHKNVFKNLNDDITISVARNDASGVANAVSDIYTITFWNGIGEAKQQLTKINHKIDIIMSVFGNNKVQIKDINTNTVISNNANPNNGKVDFKADNAGSFVAIEI